VSQILLQNSLSPQQLQSQNESLIAQIKASELFVLRHLKHSSPRSLPSAREIDCDHDLAHPPSTPFNTTAPGYPAYGDQPYIQSSPPTTPSSENDVQDQPVVSNAENVGLQQLCEVSISSFENPISRNHHGDVTQTPENMSFSNDGNSVGELQGPERAPESNDSSGTPEISRETPCDPKNAQSAISPNMVRQRCSDGRIASIRTRNARPRQVKVSLPPYAMQMRSKTGRKSRRMEPSSKANLRLTDNNALRDGDGGEGSTAAGKGILAKGPEILGSLWDKARRAGRLNVMREVVYDIIVALRDRGVAEGQQLNPQTPKVMKDHPQSTLLPAPRMDYSFRALRTELEMSSAGEQLYKLRRRVALAQFFDVYTRAQADPHAFLYPEQNKELLKSSARARKRKRPSPKGAKKYGNRLSTLVHNRIVDLMYPSLVLSDENLESEARAKQAEKVSEREAASQKVKNWRANAKPWSALIKRFDWGILLLLPTDFLDQK
jgi:hypothetical protein